MVLSTGGYRTYLAFWGVFTSMLFRRVSCSIFYSSSVVPICPLGRRFNGWWGLDAVSHRRDGDG